MILVKGKNEARRLIEQGAVSIDGERITSIKDYVLINNIPARVKWGRVNKTKHIVSHETMIIKAVTLLTHNHGDEFIMLDENNVEL